MFKDKIVVVTGGAEGIGKAIVEAFREEGALVCTIDILDNDYYVGDIASKEVLEKFAQKVIGDYGRIDCLINNACITRGGLNNCSYDDFEYVQRIGVTAPYRLTQLFMNYFMEGGSIVNISSTRDRMSQSNTESYTAAKGGITALTHAMAVTLAGKVRVNAISPGWIDTKQTYLSREDHQQHPSGRVGRPEDIASMVLYLCSDKAGFITGENMTIDGGMTRKMIYHGDEHWSYEMQSTNMEDPE